MLPFLGVLKFKRKFRRQRVNNDSQTRLLNVLGQTAIYLLGGKNVTK